MTTGELLLSKSTLTSGTALELMLNLSEGRGEDVFVDYVVVDVMEDVMSAQVIEEIATAVFEEEVYEAVLIEEEL
jgi:hypothetical protein